MADKSSLPEVFLSNRGIAAKVSKAVAEGKLRKIGPSLYTPNMRDTPEAIIRRHQWEIIGLYCPGAIVTDRTGIEHRPAADGSVFIIADRSRDLDLPGLKIRPRPGVPATDNDRTFMGNLRLASPGRLLLENMKPSRARSGVSRTLSREEMETYLDRLLNQRGDDGLNVLRDEARHLAPVLGLQEEMRELDRLIGALLGSRDGVEVSSPAAIARVAGHPYDSARLEIFEALRAALASQAPVIRKAVELDAVGKDNLAFFEAYFSNFIEGTEFAVEEAVEIVFENVIPTERPADAHDVLGTFRIVSSDHEMSTVPDTFAEFEALLKRRHAVIMEQRPDKHPGKFKTKANHFSGRYFVEPNLVVGTLEKGFEIYKSLTPGFERAAFMMYLVAEVHPFTDGNGRIARVMMNAELVSANEQRILIPIVYRNNYLQALKALSNDRHPDALIRVFDFGQRYSQAIPWHSFDQARYVMTKTNAFRRPDEADAEGIRLRLPTTQLLEEAEDMFPPPGGLHR